MKTVAKVTINAPAEIVFLWLEDADRIKQWVPNIIRDEPIIETPETIGSTFRQVFLERGKEMEMIGRITAYVANERMRVDMTGDMFNLDVDYTLTPLGSAQTELSQNTIIKFKGFIRFFAPLFGVFAKFSSSDPQAESHQKLKQLAEQEHQQR